MDLDPAAQGVLDLLDEAGLSAMEKMTPVECRAALEAIRDPSAPVADVASAVEREIDGVPVRVYSPPGDGPFPVLVWIHGGGWVFGSAERADPTARELCSRADCVVVSIDCRLAPEHKFPAAVEDVVAVSRWVGMNAAALGGDSERLAIGGDSAGGNLSAVATHHLPGIFGYQVLVYPAVDSTMSFPSIDENAEGYLLTKALMEWFRYHYLDGLDVDLTDPRLSPLYASDDVLSSCPPALVITCGYDPLRDEGRAYADKLETNGVAVERLTFANQIHGFYTFHLAIPAAYDALDATARALRGAWAG
jgi:acetyl esterase